MPVSDYDPIFDAAGKEWNVDPNLLRAVATQESNGNPQAVSGKNAHGLMQIIPETQKYLGITDPNDPTQSIYGAAKYLSEGLDKEGTPEGALLFYHGGPAWRGSYGKESAGYVPAVTAHYQKLTAASQKQPTAPTPAQQPSTGDDPFSQALSGASQPAAQSPASDPFSQALDVAQKSTKPAPAETPAPSAPTQVDDYGRPLPDVGGIKPPQAVSDIASATAQGAKEGFGSSPIGMSPQTDQALVHAGVFNGPNEYNPLKGLNRAIITPLAAAGDLALRGGQALVGAYQHGISQAGESAGVPQLGRDLAALPEAFPLGDLRGTTGVPHSPLAAAAPRMGPVEQFPMTAQSLLERPPTPLRSAVANDVYANPLARSPEATSAPSFVPPGANIPAQISSADRPAFVPPAPPAPTTPLARVAANDAPTVSPSGRAPANDTVNPLNIQTPTPPEAGPLTIAAASTRTVPSVADIPTAKVPAPVTAKIDTAPAKVEAADQASAERQRLLAPAKTGGDTTEYVPGVRLTKADATGNAVDATEAKRLSQSPEGTQAFRDLQADNNVARSAYFDQIAGDPSDVASLKAARAGQAEQDLQATWGNKGQANAQPVVDTINRILKSPDGVRPLVQQKLNQVLETLHDQSGNLQTDPEMLYGARKAIDDTLSREAAKSEPMNVRVASNLQDVKSALDKAIEPAAPGFGQYLQNFAEASKPIDKMEMLQGFQPKLTNGADRNMTFGKFDAMMKNIVQQRTSRGNNPAKSIDPQTMDALFNLHADLKRAAHTDSLAAVKGSDTSQMLDYGKKIAGKGLETALAVKTAGASIPVIHGAKTYLANRNLKKTIKNHLYPDIEKIRKKNPLSSNPDVE